MGSEAKSSQEAGEIHKPESKHMVRRSSAKESPRSKLGGSVYYDTKKSPFRGLVTSPHKS